MTYKFNIGMERIISYIVCGYENSKDIVQNMKSIELVTIPGPKDYSEEEESDNILKMFKIKEFKVHMNQKKSYSTTTENCTLFLLE